MISHTVFAGKSGDQKYTSFKAIAEGERLISKNKSYMFLIVHTSQDVISYRNEIEFQKTILSPKGLFGTRINSVGHAQVAWYCQDSREGVFTGAAGFTGETSGQVRQMVESGWGMTSLLATFDDGYVEDEYMVVEDLHFGHNEGEERNYYWVGVEVPFFDCVNGIQFIDRFQNNAEVYPSNQAGDETLYASFGFVTDPYSLQGAGCTSFAKAVIDNSLFLFDGLVGSWSRTIPLPKTILGKPGGRLPISTRFEPGILDQISPNKVSKLKFLAGHWGEINLKNSLQLQIVDPELLSYQLRLLERAYFGSQSKMKDRYIATFEAEKRIRKLGMRKPEKKSFKKVMIDRNTDKYFDQVYRATSQFKNNFPNLKVKQAKILGVPGIMISQ